jgi:hypothetical protein
MATPKITEQFKTRAGTFREKLLLALHRNAGKQVPVPALLKSVYGRGTEADWVSLGMVVKGLEGMISKDRLPFKVEKQRVDGVLTVGLHPKAKRRARSA